jgi:squalene cyclase
MTSPSAPPAAVGARTHTWAVRVSINTVGATIGADCFAAMGGNAAVPIDALASWTPVRNETRDGKGGAVARQPASSLEKESYENEIHLGICEVVGYVYLLVLR